VLGALVLGLLQASCGQEGAVNAPKRKLRIGVPAIVVSAPLIIAQEKGAFAEAGLDVALHFYPTGKMALGGLFAGEVDVASVAEIPVMFNGFARDDFAVIASFSSSYNDCKVIARRAAGIATPADLEGKRIGTAFKTNAHFFSSVYLIEHAVDPGAVTLVDLAPAEMAGALKRGAVDAVVIFEPYAVQALQALAGETFSLPRSDLYRETFNLATMKTFARDNPQALASLLRAVAATVDAMPRNRDESIAIAAKGLKVDPESIRPLWDDFNFFLSLEHSLLTTMEDQARWAIRNNLVDRTKPPNYLDLVDVTAMRDVGPGRLTIVK
jgi:NitT/TauT family transport system substrate-binding protein